MVNIILAICLANFVWFLTSANARNGFERILYIVYCFEFIILSGLCLLFAGWKF